jgi:regulator of protease activity HflC (stomatin/prohibitin superfamily)
MKQGFSEIQGTIQTYRRGAGAALLGLLVQAGSAGALGLLGLYAGSDALYGAALHAAGGLVIWGVLLAVYQQHRLERLEALAVGGEEGVGSAKSGALFDEGSDELRAARRRLGQLRRWGLGVASVGVTVYLLAAGALMLKVGVGGFEEGKFVGRAMRGEAESTTVLAVLVVVVFVGFVAARYLSGLARVGSCELLRGGASYLMGSILSGVLGLFGVLAAHYGEPVVLGIVGAAVVPGVMLALGVEMLLLLLLSVYRPRRLGEVDRASFDSRVLGWLTSPQSLSEAVREALNYQFGFEISRGWFYELLSRGMVPLTVLGSGSLVGLSGLVIVGPHEQAIVARFGRICGEPLGSGLHVKLPWPVDRAWKYPVGRVQEVTVGSEGGEAEFDRALLWSSPGARGGDYFMAAPTPFAGAGGGMESSTTGGGSGLSLVGARVVVQYRVGDLLKYVSVVESPRDVLRTLADRCTNAYFATKDIDELLGSGRVTAAVEMRELIQGEADRWGLGLEVLFVGLIGVHPPSEDGVAAAFLEQIGAEQERNTMIEQAKQEAIERLSSVAGSRESAIALDGAIRRLEGSTTVGEGERGGDETARAAAEERGIEQMMMSSRGEAAQKVYEALQDRWDRVLKERSKAERFGAELSAYERSPAYYRARLYFGVLAEGLADARKYVVETWGGQTPVFRVDLKDSSSSIDSVFKQPE